LSTNSISTPNYRNAEQRKKGKNVGPRWLKKKQKKKDSITGKSQAPYFSQHLAFHHWKKN
jgi:uncharacterized protein (DUF736 family)